MAREIATIYGMPFGFALVLALMLASSCWLVEAVLHRRIGVYLGYVAMLAVLLMILRIAYVEIKECSGLFGLAVLFPQCEWSPLIRMFAVFLIVVTMPLLIVSEMKLKKWSLNCAARTV